MLHHRITNSTIIYYYFRSLSLLYIEALCDASAIKIAERWIKLIMDVCLCDSKESCMQLVIQEGFCDITLVLENKGCALYSVCMATVPQYPSETSFGMHGALVQIKLYHRIAHGISQWLIRDGSPSGTEDPMSGAHLHSDTLCNVKTFPVCQGYIHMVYMGRWGCGVAAITYARCDCENMYTILS